MKRIFAFLLALGVLGAVSAQVQLTPPKFQGSDAQRFMARLAGEFEKVVYETGTPAEELSARVVIAFRIDTTGGITDLHYLDNTCGGRDFRDMAPATARTKEILAQAMDRLEKWTPAERGGSPEAYSYSLSLRLPIEKIVKKQAGDPLLFNGEDPEKSFHDWATIHTHYDTRFTARGVEGLVHVRFYIEPDGKITIGEVVTSPDEKLSKEVVRVIKASKGKWIPRRQNGVPQRTAYDYRVHFHAH